MFVTAKDIQQATRIRSTHHCAIIHLLPFVDKKNILCENFRQSNSVHSFPPTSKAVLFAIRTPLDEHRLATD